MSQLGNALLVRSIAVILPLIVVFLVPPLEASVLFICFGLAHLSLAFWYQKDAGKWNPRKYALVISAFALLVFVGIQVSFTTFVMMLAIIFAVHFVLDEPFFFKKQHSIYTTLEALPFLILYAGLTFDTYLGTSFFVPSILLTIAALCGYAGLSFVKKRRPDIVTLAYVFWGVIALVAYVSSTLIPSGVLSMLWFYMLTMVHYIIWYAEFWKKVKSDEKRRITYVTRSVGINIFFLVFGYFWFYGMAPIGIVFFAPLFFYVWSFLHISTSIRKGELRGSLGLS